jgi:EAL domain-containing protein (putative c-di-GMP-specific phosphodiesterase class I)/FixJ family two-component response regulator
MQIADLKFLVAEDDDFQRRWLVAMLNALGAKQVTEVSDGISALQVLLDTTQQIDISFIDLKMPGIDGMALIRHLANENHQTSLILASALDGSLLSSVKTMSEAYGIDMLGAIQKPATPESILELIELYQPPSMRNVASTVIPDFTFDEIMRGLQNREFEPLFQPKVVFDSRQVAGAEAFARWCHPHYGLLSPSAFIPVLEEKRQMDRLDWIMIEKSAEACRSWQAGGFPVSVSINLSLSSLAKPEFAEKVIEYIAQQGLKTERFIFEISESSATTNDPHFFENMTRLRMKGFGVSVDDYGTGKSSMRQLLRIPFSELKIDRSFVVGASQDPSLELVLNSSFELCQKLKRESVAVGVETQQDWDLLQKMGCTYAQGHYIAKPMEAAVLTVWMQEWAHFF